jgi:hypothetical protein
MAESSLPAAPSAAVEGATPAAKRVRRQLSATPLARRFERLVVDGGKRVSPRPIPWQRFRREDYSPEALALAGEAQRMLAMGEYAAIDLFSHLTAALALHAAPLDVIAASATVALDELRHADLALRMAALLLDGEPAIDVVGGQVERRFPRAFGLAELDVMMIELPAISETVALALLSACRDGAREPVVRAVLSSIAADEVHHARLGWYYLAWRAPQWTLAERQRAADHAGFVVANAEHRFRNGRDAPRGHRRAAQALGVLDTVRQREAIRCVMEDEIVPALDALGLGASVAWRVRRRVE